MAELDQIDKKKILESLRKYYAEVTKEQFLADLKDACPALFMDESELPETAFSRTNTRKRESSPEENALASGSTQNKPKT